jgi:hypothetical protein
MLRVVGGRLLWVPLENHGRSLQPIRPVPAEQQRSPAALTLMKLGASWGIFTPARRLVQRSVLRRAS